MTNEFKLPDIGEGLSEAEIVAWLVAPGDRVSEEQPVVEVETDKAIVEIPSPVDGTVREILAEEGDVVPIGAVIITFGPDDDTSTGERVFAAPSTRRVARELGVELGSLEGHGPGGRITEADVRTAAESSATADPVSPAAETADGEPDSAPDDAPTAATRRVDDGDPVGTADDDPGADPDGRDRTLAAPSTRTLADEMGVDLDSVPTDRTKDGKAFVTSTEVEAYAESQQRSQQVDSVAVSDDSAAGEQSDERIPYRGLRRTIGERMKHSKYTAPHATHHDEVDVTELVEIRSRLKEHAEERGVSLSSLPFVINAVVAGLRESPILNSRLDEDREEIVLRGEYNIGIATATDAGLLVPVVKNADAMGLLELADELTELTERARNRSISPEEMRDGTFSITNFGAIGGEYATPIINHPETAILGLGTITEKPRVIDGEVVPRNVMTLSLSIDHRVIDGAEAARFINTVRKHLESPELLLLD
jgi:pyruvate dehydrogenase E2 component (dihydrolipoamide acetyltransferase)